MTDGGIWALSGYLYQIIGSLGIGAFLTNQKDNPLLQGNDLDVLIQLVNVNQTGRLGIQPEVFNNDVLIIYGLKATDSGVFIQFKFSSQVHLPTIGPKEVLEIVAAFDNSVDRARANGVNITACVLITNRKFSQGDGSGGEKWEKEKNGRQGNYELREIVNITPNVFKKELVNFARRLGVVDQELDIGIKRLVGEIIIQSVDKEVNPNDFTEILTEALTNYRQTTPLTIIDLSRKCEQDLQDYGTNILGLDYWNFEPIVREAFDNLITQINQRALVTIYGPGGSGKSVLLWQLLWSKKQYCICKIEATANLVNNLLPRLVNHEWRSMPLDVCPHDTSESAIKRLLLANSESKKPLFWLGLDGLDEGFISTDQRSQLTHLIKIFLEYDQEIQKRGETSDAVLIITYRDKNYLNDFLGYIPRHSSQYPPAIRIDNFSAIEIHKGFERFFPDRLKQSPVPMYIRSSNLSHDFSDEDNEIQADESVLTALHHPVIWCALLDLDKQEQDKVIEGNPSALNLLAENILERFIFKVRRRNPNIGLPKDLIPILAKIAISTTGNKVFPMKMWLDLAQNSGESLARTLYYEAGSGGLIDLASSASWHWNHQFVYDYLKNYQG